MAIKVVEITNTSASKSLVVSTGLSAEPVLRPSETREVLVGVPSRPESFITDLETAGLVTVAEPGTGPLAVKLAAGDVVVDSDNFTHMPEVIPDFSAIPNYRGPIRANFWDDVHATIKIRNPHLDTFAEAAEAGIDLDQTSHSISTEGGYAYLANEGVVYTAVTVGASGNGITVRVVDPEALTATTTFAAVGTDITVTLSHDGTDITATAQSLCSEFADAPAAVKALIAVTGSGVTALTALAKTNLSGATVAYGPGLTLGKIDLSLVGYAGDYADIIDQYLAVDVPAVGAVTTLTGAVLSRVKKKLTLTITDPVSGKTATFRSLDQINEAWEHVSSNGAGAAAIVVASSATA